MSDHPEIWFLRHGETEWNAERRVQGQMESRLTARGAEQARRQAELIAPVLERRPHLFASPLLRARQTAKIALGDAPVRLDRRLMEIHAGDWQGRLYSDLGRPLDDIAPLDLFADAPGGEGFDPFRDRVAAFLADLPGPSVIVGHGLWGQVLRGLVTGRDRDGMGQLPNRQGVIFHLSGGRERLIEEA